MLISEENLVIKNALSDFERRVDEMHNEFSKYHHGEIQKMPEWEKLEKDLVIYSRRKISDLELSTQLNRVLYKFQNRKKIWLAWAEEVHLAH
jgi:hypothetical protein